MALSIEERVINLIAVQFDIDPEEFDEASFLTDDLGADPPELEVLSVLLAEEFDIDIPEEEFEVWETVADVISYVTEKLRDEE